MKNLNACLASLNLGLPDDVRRLKEAGYYTEAIACIDTYLAEDWTKTQNQPVQPVGPLPENPTPRGVDAMRDALLAQREILRRLPLDYTVPEAQALELLQSLVRDFTPEEFRALDRAGAMDWRFVEGEKRYIRSFAETLLATHPELAARQIDPPQQHPSWERYEPEHEQMVRTGAVSADITLETSIGMSDEAFAAALAAAKQQGRSTVHVRVWLPLPAACPAQSGITLDSFTEPPTCIAPEDAAQRTAYWEADLAENRPFGAVYSYRTTARYADPLHMQADPVQPDFDTQEELPHLEFTPYLRALAAQLTQGHHRPGAEGKAHLRLCDPQHPLPLPAALLRAGKHHRRLCPQPPGRLRHHGLYLHRAVPSGRHPGPVAERPCGAAGDGGLPRLGRVLHRAPGLDVRRLLGRCLHGPRRE